MRRLLIQFGFFLLQNPFLHNFISGRIHQGETKSFCTPGLNCYSCPAAAFSCPIGAAQMFFAGARQTLSLFVAGFLLSVGVIFAKFICGFVCPMGLLQDLVYRVPTPKIVTPLRFLKYVKYAVLALFVVVLPFAVRRDATGLGLPWFCAYVCPSGTIFAAVPLLAANDFLRYQIGAQFFLKITIAVVLMILSVFVLRFFCRVLCPLGAIYGMFNRVAVLRMHCDKEKCTACGRCKNACGIRIEPTVHPNDPECFRCGKCVKSCNEKALKIGVCTPRSIQ
ncbi:MAG: 4Fe-4S binding protein [Defluviitaleaceae bacterium]|nr:4Fe-4S binding protein [Defluviitaleaceae bacterium]